MRVLALSVSVFFGFRHFVIPVTNFVFFFQDIPYDQIYSIIEPKQVGSPTTEELFIHQYSHDFTTPTAKKVLEVGVPDLSTASAFPTTSGTIPFPSLQSQFPRGPVNKNKFDQIHLLEPKNPWLVFLSSSCVQLEE